MDRGSHARAERARPDSHDHDAVDRGPSAREIARVRGVVRSVIAQRTNFRSSGDGAEGSAPRASSLTAATANTVSPREVARVRGLVQSLVAQRTNFRGGLKSDDGGSPSRTTLTSPTATGAQVREVSKREADRVQGLVQSAIAQRTQFRASLRTGPEAEQKPSSSVVTVAARSKDASEANRQRVEGLSSAQREHVQRALDNAASYVRAKLGRQ